MSQQQQIGRPGLWSCDEVASYLLGEEVDEEVILKFMEREIDGDKLLALTEEKLVDMGVAKRKERNGLMYLVQKLSSSSSSPPPAPSIQGAIKHDPSQEDDKEGRFGLCETHMQPFVFHCAPCDKLVCRECISSDPPSTHRDHELLSPAERAREQLQGFIRRLGEQSSHVEKVLKECGEAIEKLARTTLVSVEEITSTRDRLIKVIHEAADVSLAQVREHEAMKKAYLYRKVEENLALKKEVDVLKADLSQLIQESSQSLMVQQCRTSKDACMQLLGKERVLAIAELDPMRSVNVAVSESLANILEFVEKSLFLVSENGLLRLSGGIRPLNDDSELVHEEGSMRIVAIGGVAGDYLDTVELFDSLTQQWTRLPNMAAKRGSYPAVGHCSDKVYVAGGFDGSTYLASAEVLDLATMTWTALPPMGTIRFLTSGVCFGENGARFLVAGGFNGGSLRSCEAYDPDANAWSPFASLSSPRSEHCMVLFRGQPVVLGGKVGEELLHTCETFTPTIKKWNSFPSFSTARRWFGAAVVLDKIYIAGGENGPVLDSIEVYDGSSWLTLATHLTRPRYCCGAVCFNQTLVVVGGNNRKVEVYDPTSGSLSDDVIPEMPCSPKREDLAVVSC